MSRIVFITGGTRGIGQSIAVAFAAQGDTVIVGGRRPPAHDRYAFAAGDVRDPANVDQIITDIVSEHGGIDVLVNNAGGSPSVDSATASPRFTESIASLISSIG